MKKNLCCIITGVIFLSCISLSAQPTLTATGINPIIGEQFTYNYASYANPGNAGENQIWDFSFMQDSSSSQTIVVDPSTTPNGSMFPLANIALTSSTNSGITYYKTSSFAFQDYGNSSIYNVLKYPNPEDILHFPFTYHNSFNDTLATQYDLSGNTYYRKGTDTVKADGYGTLITPTEKYTDVLRIHFIELVNDSVYLQGASNNFVLLTDKYVWYKNGIHTPLATIYVSKYAGVMTLSQYSFYLATTTGINDTHNYLRISNVYPNPATEKLNINISLTQNTKITVRVVNALGQTMKQNQSVNGIHGLNTVCLNVSGLMDGIYFAQILLNDNVYTTKRFIKSKKDL